MDGPQLGVKSFEIPKRLVYEAWMKVQQNGGAPGVDAVSIDRFADNERANLYKLWLCRARDYAEWVAPGLSRGWSDCSELSEDSA
jgi:hypothetical protein